LDLLKNELLENEEPAMKRVDQSHPVVFLKNEKIEQLFSMDSCLLGDLGKRKKPPAWKRLQKSWKALFSMIGR